MNVRALVIERRLHVKNAIALSEGLEGERSLLYCL